MNARHARFVQEFLIDGNAAAAARRAGYSVRCAKAVGSRLLTYVDIQAAIRAGQHAAADRLELDRQRVLDELRGVVELAREQRNPSTQPLLCDYYAPKPVRPPDRCLRGISGYVFTAVGPGASRPTYGPLGHALMAWYYPR